MDFTNFDWVGADGREVGQSPRSWQPLAQTLYLSGSLREGEAIRSKARESLRPGGAAEAQVEELRAGWACVARSPG